MNNPKLINSNIIDCIPQTGKCPHNCPECFYNNNFFRTLDKSLVPTKEEVGDRIVRVNSGNDSNNNRSLVLNTINKQKYDKFFFNTSIPKFDFPAPVVFTCNPKIYDGYIIVNDHPLLMFVRIKVAPWDMDNVNRATDYYNNVLKIPVVLTFMRYYNGDIIPDEYRNNFTHTKHILNEYYCLKPEVIMDIMSKFNGTGVRMCGTPYSSYCSDCGNCEEFYYKCMEKFNILNA